MKFIYIDSKLYTLLKESGVNFETLTIEKLSTLVDSITARNIDVSSAAIGKKLTGIAECSLLLCESYIVTEQKSEVISSYTTFISDELLTIVHGAPLGKTSSNCLIGSIIKAAADRYTFSEMMNMPNYKNAFKAQCKRR